jgi:hypothetical protein
VNSNNKLRRGLTLNKTIKDLFCQYRSASCITVDDFLGVGLSEEDFQNYLDLSITMYAASIVCIADLPSLDKPSSVMEFSIVAFAWKRLGIWLSNVIGEECRAEASYAKLLSFRCAQDISCSMHYISEYFPCKFLSFDKFGILLENSIRAMLLGIPITETTSDECDDSYEDNLELESLLHKSGYHVGKNGLSINERWGLLRRLIDTHALSKDEIDRTISNSLRIFKGRDEYFKAVRDWEKDLEFVRSL